MHIWWANPFSINILIIDSFVTLNNQINRHDISSGGMNRIRCKQLITRYYLFYLIRHWPVSKLGKSSVFAAFIDLASRFYFACIAKLANFFTTREEKVPIVLTKNNERYRFGQRKGNFYRKFHQRILYFPSVLCLPFRADYFPCIADASYFIFPEVGP